MEQSGARSWLQIFFGGIMFAVKSLTGIVTRLLLSVVILFNALVTTASNAKSADAESNFDTSSETQNWESLKETETVYQSFVRPISRVSEPVRETDNALLQTGTALLKCDSNCSDPNPNI